MEVKYCQNCGTVISDNSDCCCKCGAKIECVTNTIKEISDESKDKLRTAKFLGGIGWLIVFISIFVPGIIRLLLPTIGFIIFIIAMKHIADAVNEPSIFNKTLAYVIGSIIVIVIVFALGLIGIIASATKGNIPEQSKLATIITWIALMWIGLIFVTSYFKSALDITAQKLSVNAFRTAGTLYLWGTILLVIIVGAIILFIAEIILMVAFFSIPDPSQIKLETQTIVQSIKRKCKNCGKDMSQDDQYCSECGYKN